MLLTEYDADVAPAAADWLALDEAERVQLAEAYHRRLGIDHPQLKLHATIHAVVENQVASREVEVLDAFARLQKEGLTRHEAVHAVGLVVVEHMVEVFKSKTGAGTSPVTPYGERVRQLTAEVWRRSGDRTDEQLTAPGSDPD
jgi:hypothetical protein